MTWNRACFGGDAVRDGARTVGGIVVHAHDLDLRLETQQLVGEPGQILGFVVRGNDHSDAHASPPEESVRYAQSVCQNEATQYSPPSRRRSRAWCAREQWSEAEPMASKTERLRAVYDVHGEKFRFLVVGAWNTLFSYVLFAVLLYLLAPVLQPLADSEYAVVAWIGEHYYLVVQWLTWIVAVPQSTASAQVPRVSQQGPLARRGRPLLLRLPADAGVQLSDCCGCSRA